MRVASAAVVSWRDRRPFRAPRGRRLFSRRQMTGLACIALGTLLVASAARGQAPEPAPLPFEASIAQARAALAAAPAADTAAHAAATLALAELLHARGGALDDQRLRADGAERTVHASSAVAAHREAADLAAAVARAAWTRVQAEREAAAPDAAPDAPPSADDALAQRAWFLEVRARLGQGAAGLAAVPVGDDAARSAARGQIRQALERSEALAWEYDGWWTGYWATLTLGRCHAALGRHADAEVHLQAVLALPLTDDTAALRQAAWWRLAESRFDAGDAAAALQACTKLAREYPQHLESWAGQGAAITQARVQAAEGDLASAVETVLALTKAEHRHRYATALDWIAHWADRLPDASAEVRWITGRALQRQGALGRGPAAYTRAIRAYQQAAQAVHTPEERQAYGISTWSAIGDCYAAMEQWSEAAIAYGRGASAAAIDREAAGDCAERAYYAWQQAYRRNGSDEVRGRLQTARQRLLEDFPERADGAALRLAAARDLERAHRWLDAAAAYERVDPSDDAWRRAQLRAGACRWSAYRERTADQAPGAPELDLCEAARANLRAARDAGPDNADAAAARYLLAAIAAARDEHATVVQELDGYAAHHATTKGARVDGALAMRIRALCALERATEAEADCATLARIAPDSVHLASARLRVAQALDAIAGDDVSIAERAAVLYRDWLAAQVEPAIATRLAVALRFRRLADALPDGEARRAWYGRAAELYRPIHAAGLDDADTRWAVLVDLATCEEALQRFDAARPLLEAIVAERPRTLEGWERLAGCLRQLTAEAGAPQRTERLQRAAECQEQLLRFHGEFQPAWWDAKWWQIEVMRRQGRKADARKLLTNLHAVAFTLGGAEWRQRFVDLGIACGLPDAWAH